MSAEERGSSLDTPLLWLAFGMVVAGIYGFYHFETDYGTLVRTVGLLVVIALAVGVVYMTQAGKSGMGYVQGARIEWRKIVWPTRAEGIQTSLIIFVVVVIIGLVIWGVDSLLLAIVQWLTGRGD